MTGSSLTVEITLDDGRIIVATPRPEDQDLLQAWTDRDIALTSSPDDSDTSGHAVSDDITLDVEGHAMTLRLPNSTDVDTLKKALAVGAVSATIVAAGAIAAMQGNQAAPAVPQVVTPVVVQAPAPAADFQLRREQQIDEMLAAPPAIPQVVAPVQVQAPAPAADFQLRREQQIDEMLGAPPAAAPLPAQVQPIPVTGPASVAAPSEDFQTRREHATDEMLAAPPPEPIVTDSGSSD